MIYCYTTDDGDSFEIDFSMGDAPQTVSVGNGVKAHRDHNAEWIQDRATRTTHAKWPMRSMTCGVSPRQTKEAAAHDRSLGVPTDYDKKTGDVIWRDNQHRNQWIEAHGGIDRDAGYGQYAGE